MKKTMTRSIILFILMVVVFFSGVQSAFCEVKVVKKDIETESKDGRILKATMTYPKTNLKVYPTVILLHSLGCSSGDWGNLIEALNTAGFLVIAMDFRGHGKSIYNTNFKRNSWVYFKPKAYQKFPSDVLAVIKQAQVVSKKVSLDCYAFVGADIGANTAVLAANEMPKKPKALVLISPSSSFKGLYIPVALTETGQIPILSMVSNKDGYSLKEQKSLAKFAQGNFYAMNYPNGGMGMLMLKVNPSMSVDITNWLVKTMR